MEIWLDDEWYISTAPMNTTLVHRYLGKPRRKGVEPQMQEDVCYPKDVAGAVQSYLKKVRVNKSQAKTLQQFLDEQREIEERLTAIANRMREYAGKDMVVPPPVLFEAAAVVEDL